jgi:hypothetical protein
MHHFHSSPQHFRRLLAAVIVLTCAALCRAESVTVATYNIENFRLNFTFDKVRDATLHSDPNLNSDLRSALRRANDKDNWAASKVILDKDFAPDILMLQESAGQADLEFFNQRWLNNAYATVRVFRTNSGRGQNLAMFIKPGFTLVEVRDEFHLEPDPKPEDRTPAATEATTRPAGGEAEGAPGIDGAVRLFARGPGFALIRTPGGREMWVGNTHQKSKSGNSAAVTRWRNREATRTVEIIRELHKGGKPVIFVGDFNDELGVQEFEAEAGSSTIELFMVPGLDLITKPLHDAGQNSFQGYFRTRFRTLIDHIVITDDLKPAVSTVQIVRTPWAEMASDHLPVFTRLDLSKVPPPPPPSPPPAAP